MTGIFLHATVVTWGGMDTEIRVSTESWPWRTKFSHHSCGDLNLGPFDHESNTLTTELSPFLESLVRWLQWCLKILCWGLNKPCSTNPPLHSCVPPTPTPLVSIHSCHLQTCSTCSWACHSTKKQNIILRGWRKQIQSCCCCCSCRLLSRLWLIVAHYRWISWKLIF